MSRRLTWSVIDGQPVLHDLDDPPASELVYQPTDEPPWPDEPAIGGRPNAKQTTNDAVVKPISLAVFLAEPEPDGHDLVTGLGLPPVGVAILAGPPKSLKTMLAGQLAICLANADGPLPFLDHDIPAGGSVLFVEEEGNRDRLRERFRRQVDGLGATDPAIELLLFTGVRLDDDASVKRLADAIRSASHRLAVLDPFGFLHGQDENKPAAMAPIMRRLARTAADCNTLILVLHHVTKPQADRPAGRLGDRIRGASSITAGVDALLVLDREGDRRAHLQGESRDAEPDDLHLELDTETLLLSPTDVPLAAGSTSIDGLRAFIEESGQVAASDVMKRFGIRSKATALAYLEALPGIDRYTGPRGAYYFKARP